MGRSPESIKAAHAARADAGTFRGRRVVELRRFALHDAYSGPVAREFGAEPSELVSRRLRAILMVGVALLAGIAWLALQTRAMAETQSFAETAAAVPSVLFGTRFGQVLCLQAAALAGAALLVAANVRFSALAALLAGLAVLLEAGHSHAFAMAHGVSPLLLSQSVHLLAAGAWLGGLLPLLVVVAHAPLDMARRSLRRFSALAATAVCLLAGTAILQGIELSGGLNGLFGTAYGAVLLIKAALFAMLIALAANNRLRLTPALASRENEGTRRSLALSIGIETAVGLLVVLGGRFERPGARHAHHKWLREIAKSLSALHQVGNVQCDVRKGGVASMPKFKILLACGWV